MCLSVLVFGVGPVESGYGVRRYLRDQSRGGQEVHRAWSTGAVELRGTEIQEATV
jgi:hypothetical protein